MSLQDLLHRGRPPQTGGSSGREENDEASAIRGAIEIGAQSGQIHGGQRGLSGRGPMPEGTVPECGGQHGGWNEKEQETLHRSARKLATICGAIIMSATITAQIQNTTTLARLRWAQDAPRR
jgi:hypothetical protein